MNSVEVKQCAALSHPVNPEDHFYEAEDTSPEKEPDGATCVGNQTMTRVPVMLVTLMALVTTGDLVSSCSDNWPELGIPGHTSVFLTHNAEGVGKGDGDVHL